MDIVSAEHLVIKVEGRQQSPRNTVSREPASYLIQGFFDIERALPVGMLGHHAF